MSDDNVVTGRTVIATDWQPTPLTLTVDCWIATKHRGEKKADLVKQDTRSIEVELTRAAAAIKIAEDKFNDSSGPNPTEEERKAASVALVEVDAAFRAYRPLRSVSGREIRHEQMVTIVEQFQKLALEEKNRVEAMHA